MSVETPATKFAESQKAVKDAEPVYPKYVPTPFVVPQAAPDGTVNEVDLTHYCCTSDEANAIFNQVKKFFVPGNHIKWSGQDSIIGSCYLQDMSFATYFQYQYPPPPAPQERPWGLMLLLLVGDKHVQTLWEEANLQGLQENMYREGVGKPGKWTLGPNVPYGCPQLNFVYSV